VTRSPIARSTRSRERWQERPGTPPWLTDGQRRRRLGSGRAEPVAFNATLRPGAVLVGSDGLFRHVDAATIAATRRRHPPPPAAATAATPCAVATP